MGYITENIRNICLVGHASAGKTSLAEAMLAKTGAIGSPGSVESGDTVCDFTPQERKLGHSLDSAVVHLEHEGTEINLIDTPGYPDFSGRAEAVLPAVETAAVVVSAQAGVEMMTLKHMEAARDNNLCRIVIINKIDAERVDLEAVLESVQSRFGAECLPLNLPAAEGGGVVDCYFSPNGTSTRFSSAEQAHTQIIDQVVEVDDDLMELYLEQGEELKPEQLHAAFETALRQGHLIPVCFVSAKTGAGLEQLLNVIALLMPNPTEGNPPTFFKGEAGDAEVVDVQCDPKGHVIGHVFKINIDPFKGRLGIFRVHQGTVKAGGQLYVGDARKSMKVQHLLKVCGGEHTDIAEAVPGDIVAIPRAEDVYIDAVLHDSHDEDNFHLKSIDLPPPMYGLAISPKNDNDAQKLSDAMHALEAEDPSLKVEHIASLNETVLRGRGELHLRMVLERINEQYHVEVDTQLPGIAYRETITASADGHNRHKKQTGGAGQFGEVYLRVEPLPRGSGFEFENKVVGGVIPSQFIPAVEKGVRQVLEHGAVAGYALQDVKVTVYDGKHHAVDSKEIAFVQAGRKAFLDAISKAHPMVMEPIVNVSIVSPGDCMGDITGDLASMRGMVRGTEMRSDGHVDIRGQVPLNELQTYHSRLKSLTGGEGSFTMEFSHYAQLPAQAQQELASEFRPQDEE
ncbi:MAG: elongation factor G [Gammaproteobacteria bacterium]|nr:elongation factor G [Gammaproteobacteria bacterium]